MNIIKYLKNIFTLCFFLSFTLLSCVAKSNNMEELVKNNQFDFDLININGSYGGSIYNKYDTWECNFGRNFLYFNFDSRRIFEDKVEVSYISGNFILYGNPSYRFYGYPKKTVISISKEQIQKRINSLKKGNYKENRNINKNILLTTDKVETNGLAIVENVRIREYPSVNSDIKILGKLAKFQKIKILGESDNIDIIENLKSFWYRIRTEDGTEGWVFGGFAKIYFSDDDLDLLYKAFEKEGSEYTNQFLTPDNS